MLFDGSGKRYLVGFSLALGWTSDRRPLRCKPEHAPCKWRAVSDRKLLSNHYYQPFASPRMLRVDLDLLYNTPYNPANPQNKHKH